MLALVAALAAAAPAHAKSPPTLADRQLAAAETLIDAFYSFDAARLRPVLAHAPKSAPNILYYQGWAEGGNYQVLDRQTCRHDKPDEVACAIKVKDDLVPALGIPYDVTDTFHISFTGDRITAVRTSSDDPPEFVEALKWINAQRPTLLDEQCRGFFDGGPTPQLCVREVVKGFRDFRSAKRSSRSR